MPRTPSHKLYPKPPKPKDSHSEFHMEDAFGHLHNMVEQVQSEIKKLKDDDVPAIDIEMAVTRKYPEVADQVGVESAESAGSGEKSAQAQAIEWTKPTLRYCEFIGGMVDAQWELPQFSIDMQWAIQSGESPRVSITNSMTGEEWNNVDISFLDRFLGQGSADTMLREVDQNLKDTSNEYGQVWQDMTYPDDAAVRNWGPPQTMHASISMGAAVTFHGPSVCMNCGKSVEPPNQYYCDTACSEAYEAGGGDRVRKYRNTIYPAKPGGCVSCGADIPPSHEDVDMCKTCLLPALYKQYPDIDPMIPYLRVKDMFSNVSPEEDTEAILRRLNLLSPTTK